MAILNTSLIISFKIGFYFIAFSQFCLASLRAVVLAGK